MRVKTGVVRRRKHHKILLAAKGYWMSRNKLYKKAHEAVLHAGVYAFHGRKRKKHDFRRLWTIRINAALGKRGLKYSRFIKILKDSQVELDRKILAQLATSQKEAFSRLVDGLTQPKKPSAGAN